MIRWRCSDCGLQLVEPVYPIACGCGTVWESEGVRASDRCVHEGEPLGEWKGCGCSAKPTIFACAIHGECLRHRVARAPGREKWSGAVCVSCDDWQGA